MPTHIMLDLETLGTRPGSVILSIGAAAFDPLGEGVSDTFHMAVEPADAERCGLQIDAGTVLWWMDPARAEAREAWFRLPRQSLNVALLEFAKWLARRAARDDRVIWGNGANFDNVLLRCAYEAWGIPAPWSYRGDRCFRTLRKLAPHAFADAATMVEHDALTDAIAQAYQAQDIVRALGLKAL